MIELKFQDFTLISLLLISMSQLFHLMLISILILQAMQTNTIPKVKQQKLKDQLNSSHIFQQIHPYFQYFNLSSNIFDKNGNRVFQDQHQLIEERGGWPYYKPIKSKRFGLNILGRYDNQDDSWLHPKHNKKQWPGAFHGIRYPNAKSRFNQNTTVLNDIIKGLQIGTMLKPGINNDYQSMISVNTDEIIGKGVYLTPHFHIALQYAESIQIPNIEQKFSLVLQCRVNPRHIKVCVDQTEWVVNNGQNVRPYGIILISQKEKREYINSMVQYGQVFDDQKYKLKIEQYLSVNSQRQELASFQGIKNQL